MKKFLTLALLCLMSVVVWAENITIDNIIYMTNSDGTTCYVNGPAYGVTLTEACIYETVEGTSGTYTVTSVAGDAFNAAYSSSSLEFVSIPATVTELKARAFHNQTNLATIVCYAETAPTVTTNTFGNVSATVYVPDESISDYESTWTASTAGATSLTFKGLSEYSEGGSSDEPAGGYTLTFNPENGGTETIPAEGFTTFTISCADGLTDNGFGDRTWRLSGDETSVSVKKCEALADGTGYTCTLVSAITTPGTYSLQYSTRSGWTTGIPAGDFLLGPDKLVESEEVTYSFTLVAGDEEEETDVYAVIDGIAYHLYDGVAAVASYQVNYDGATVSGAITIPVSVTYNGDTYDVVAIEEYAYDQQDGLTSVDCQAHITSVGARAFSHCYYLEAFYIYEETPPTAAGTAFSSVGTKYVDDDGDCLCILYVPAGTETTYGGTTGWADFVNRKAISSDEPAVEPTTFEWSVTPVEGVVTSLSTITFTCETGIYNEDASTASDIKVYKDGGSEAVTYAATVTPGFESNLYEETFTIALNDELTEAGEYTVVIPAGFFYFYVDGRSGDVENEEITLTYTIEGGGSGEPADDHEGDYLTPAIMGLEMNTTAIQTVTYTGPSGTDYKTYLVVDGENFKFNGTTNCIHNTTSVGYLRKVIVTAASAATATMSVRGSDEPLTYNYMPSPTSYGTEVGTITLVAGEEVTLDVEGDYPYFAITISSGYSGQADYVSSLELFWETAGDDDEPAGDPTATFDFTVDPVEGGVESLSVITLTSETMFMGTDGGGLVYEGTVSVYKDGSEELITTSKSIEGDFVSSTDAADTYLIITLTDVLTDEGEYTVVIPEGTFYWFNNDDPVLNEEITLTYTIAAATGGSDELYYLVPENGTMVKTLESFDLMWNDNGEYNENNNGMGWQDQSADGWSGTVYDEDGNEVTTIYFDSYIWPEDYTSSWPEAVGLRYAFSNYITDPGTYTVTIPAGMVSFGSTTHGSLGVYYEDIVVTYTVAGAGYSVSPKNGTDVTGLTVITITADEGDIVLVDDSPLSVTNRDGEEVTTATIALVDGVLVITLDEALTAPQQAGDYYITIAEGAFTCNGVENDKLSLVYYVNPDVEYTLDPADGESVNSIATVTVGYHDGIGVASGVAASSITLTGADGTEYAMASYDILETTYDGDDNATMYAVVFALEEPITADGTYTLNIPKGSLQFYVGTTADDDEGIGGGGVSDGWLESNAITATYTVDSSLAAPVSYDVVIAPESGSVVDALTSFTIYCEATMTNLWTVDDIPVTNQDGDVVAYVLIETPLEQNDTFQTLMFLAEIVDANYDALTISESGEYTIVIPAEYLLLGEDQYNDEITIKYTINEPFDTSSDGTSGDHNYRVSPAEGSVESLWQIRFACTDEGKGIYGADDDKYVADDLKVYLAGGSEPVATATAVVGTNETSPWYNDYVTITLDQKLRAEGTYTVVIPEGYFYWYVDGAEGDELNSEITLTYTIGAVEAKTYDYVVDPDPSDEIYELYNISILYDDGLQTNFKESQLGNIVLYDANGAVVREAVIATPIGSYAEPPYTGYKFTLGNNLTGQAVTEPGDYYFVIPAGYLSFYDVALAAWVETTEAIVVPYTIVVDTYEPQDLSFEVEPADGAEVTSLKTITILRAAGLDNRAGSGAESFGITTYADDGDDDAPADGVTLSDLIVYDENGNVVTYVGGVSEEADDNWELYNISITYSLKNSVVDPGTYYFVIPAGAFVLYENGRYFDNPATTLTYYVTGGDIADGLYFDPESETTHESLNGFTVNYVGDGGMSVNLTPSDGVSVVDPTTGEEYTYADYEEICDENGICQSVVFTFATPLTKIGTYYVIIPEGYLNYGYGNANDTITLIYYIADLTGIDGVDVDYATKDVYTLSGQKVNAPTKKGVYIIDGKKVYVK